jgi:hypothetical protein
MNQRLREPSTPDQYSEGSSDSTPNDQYNFQPLFSATQTYLEQTRRRLLETDEMGMMSQLMGSIRSTPVEPAVGHS